MLILVGCTMFRRDTIFKPISDNDYIEHYRPLLLTTISIYEKGMSKELQTSLAKSILDMDRQVIDAEEADIYDSILSILDPILEERERNEISNEEAQSALMSLEFIKNKYKNSPLMKKIYPKLKKVLQSNVI